MRTVNSCHPPTHFRGPISSHPRSVSPWHLLPVPPVPGRGLFFHGVVDHLSRTAWSCLLRKQHLVSAKRGTEAGSGAVGRAAGVTTVERICISQQSHPRSPAKQEECSLSSWGCSPVGTESGEQMASLWKTRSCLLLWGHSLSP